MSLRYLVETSTRCTEYFLYVVFYFRKYIYEEILLSKAARKINIVILTLAAEHSHTYPRYNTDYSGSEYQRVPISPKANPFIGINFSNLRETSQVIYISSSTTRIDIQDQSHHLSTRTYTWPYPPNPQASHPLTHTELDHN